MNQLQRILFTGAPGAGKTTLLEQLRVAGFSICQESARSIIQARQAGGLTPRPDDFAKQVLARDLRSWRGRPDQTQPVFYDRGVPDALGMLEVDEVTVKYYLDRYPYGRNVFFFEAWPEIYQRDAQRDQTLKEAFEVAASLRRWYQKLGFILIEVPQAGIEVRKRFILETLTLDSTESKS